MRFRGAFLVAFAGVLLAGSFVPAHATTVEEKSFRDLVTEAPSIVHGTVVATSSRWTENRSLIVTDIRIRVHETLKGAASSEVTVTQPGGRVGNIQVEADGAMAFRPGEETILFLNQSPRGLTYVVGMTQGRFRVEEDRQGRKVVRGLTPEHLNVIRPATAPVFGETGPPLGKDVPIDEFLGGVRKMVRDAIQEGGR